MDKKRVAPPDNLIIFGHGTMVTGQGAVCSTPVLTLPRTIPLMVPNPLEPITIQYALTSPANFTISSLALPIRTAFSYEIFRPFNVCAALSKIAFAHHGQILQIPLEIKRLTLGSLNSINM